MAFIKTIDTDAASGLLSRVYSAAQRAGKGFNIVRVQSNNPPALKASMDLYASIMLRESPLSRVQREMLAVVVSRVNNCHY